MTVLLLKIPSLVKSKDDMRGLSRIQPVFWAKNTPEMASIMLTTFPILLVTFSWVAMLSGTYREKGIATWPQLSKIQKGTERCYTRFRTLI
jgi:hypothetical protein